MFVRRYFQTLLMGANIIFRGLWKVENLKLYFHRESALRLFTGFLKTNRGNGKGGAEYNFFNLRIHFVV